MNRFDGYERLDAVYENHESQVPKRKRSISEMMEEHEAYMANIKPMGSIWKNSRQEEERSWEYKEFLGLV